MSEIKAGAERLADAIERNDEKAAKAEFIAFLVTAGTLLERAVVALESIAEGYAEPVITGDTITPLNLDAEAS